MSTGIAFDETHDHGPRAAMLAWALALWLVATAAALLPPGLQGGAPAPTGSIRRDDATWTLSLRPSPLGREVHLDQHLTVGQRPIQLTMRGSGPLRSVGAGLSVPDLVVTDRVQIGAQLDGWRQAAFGVGGAALADVEVRLTRHRSLWVRVGYKSGGYLPGHDVDPGPILGVTLRRG